MQKLFLYIKGYVYFKVIGFAPERFVNLCGNRGLFLWGISKEEESYFMYMKLQDFFKIAPLVRKTKTKVVLLQRIGLPFFIPEIYKRKFFMLGMVFTFWVWHMSSFFVWKIEIQGNVRITQEDIIRSLNAQHVFVGQKVKLIDYEELEKYLRGIYPDIIWISVKQNGTIIDITVKEKETATKIETIDKTPCDLISSKDGIIKKMVVRKGVPVLGVGDIVKKGDLIVSGKIEILNDDATLRRTNLVVSDADIWIEHEMPVHIELPKIFTEKIYTGRIMSNYMFVFKNGKTFSTNFKIPYCYHDEIGIWEPSLRLLLWDIPFNVLIKEIREYQIVEFENNFEIASQKLEMEFSDFLSNLMEKGVQIISKNVRIEEGLEKWILTGNLTVLEEGYLENQIEDVYD